MEALPFALPFVVEEEPSSYPYHSLSFLPSKWLLSIEKEWKDEEMLPLYEMEQDVHHPNPKGKRIP